MPSSPSLELPPPTANRASIARWISLVGNRFTESLGHGLLLEILKDAMREQLAKPWVLALEETTFERVILNYGDTMSTTL